MILNKNKSLEPIFVQNLRQGEAAHFIKTRWFVIFVAPYFLT
ncbi:Membrane-bound lytic murein transglycosylase A precursor [Escherichia coli ISC41]|nr:Membrane-bound lytic murein transglycosylase A precursor [Escherichia coli ISC41]